VIMLVSKRCLFINRHAPYGSSHPQETLDMAYALAAFEHRVSLLFMDDGVYQILHNQAPAMIGMKEISHAFRAWEDYGIEHLYVEKASLEIRGIGVEELLVNVCLVSSTELHEIMEQQDFIFSD